MKGFRRLLEYLRKYIIFRVLFVNIGLIRRKGFRSWFFGVLELFSRYLPGEVGNYLRYNSYKHLLKSLGCDTVFFDGVVIENPENVSIGSFCSLNHRVQIIGYGGVTIGDYVRIAPNVCIVSHNLRYWKSEGPMISQGYEPSEVEVESDVWIGTGAVVLAGVKIGRGSVIGAGSVVTKDVPEFSVVAGVPVKMIKKRTP